MSAEIEAIRARIREIVGGSTPDARDTALVSIRELIAWGHELDRLATLRAGVVGEVTDAMVELALNAPLGLTTKVWHMMRARTPTDELAARNWERAIMRAALTAALGRTDTENR